MTVQKDEQVRKRVEFVAKDSAEQVATGIVMVPDKVDLQGDYVRPETIQGFSEQFQALEDVGNAGGGVMHAVWPDDHIGLDANRVLEAAEEIGGREAPAGAWVQSWKFNDDELWSLVDDGVLEGYSIGAVDVQWSPSMGPDDLPDDVDVAGDYPDDGPFWELRDGIVREVSAVDIPAVPDAEILATKADADKRLAEHLGNRDGFLEEAMERGHSEADAERLWEYLNRAVEMEGSGDPGKQSMLARAGKAFLSTLTGTDDDDHGSKASSEDLDPANAGTAKEGRTLSRSNRDALFASIDAQLGVLDDAGIDHGATRFTDRDDVDFDISEFDGKTVSSSKDASGGETPGETMTDSDKDTNTSDVEEKFEALEKRLDEIEEQHSDKNTADEDGEGDGLEAKVDALTEQVENLAEAAGKSQQLSSGGDGGSSDGDGPTKADVLGLPGGDA